MRRQPFSEAPARCTTKRALGSALVVLVLCLQSACTLADVNVQGSDEEVLFAGGRVSHQLSGESESGAQNSSPRRESTLSLELDLSYGSGDDEQQLGVGQVLVLGGQTFLGPRRLELDFDLTRVLLDVRFATPDLHGLRAEFFGGLEYSSMDVLVRAAVPPPTQPGSDTVGAIGPAVGMGVAWQPLDQLRLGLEGRLGAGFSSEVDDLELSSLDAGLSVFPIESVGLYAGWRWVSYEAGGGGSGLESDLDLELSGPVLALWVRL